MTEQGERGELWVRRRAEKDRKRRQKLRKRLEAEGCSEALIERIIAQERLILSLLRRKSTITKYQYDRIRGDTALRKEKE